MLAGGTAVGQLALILASPIITRLYTPEDLGTLSLYLSFLNLARIVASLRYETAIVGASDEEESAYLVLMSIVLALVISPLLSLLLLIMIRLSWLGFDTLPAEAALLALPSLLLATTFATLRYWFIRKGDFKVVSRVPVYQNVGRSVTQIALGLAQMSWLGLVLGEIIGRAFGITGMIRAALAEVRQFVTPMRWHHVLSVLRRYWKFPVYSLPSSLLNSMATYIVVPLLVVYYGTDAAGHYGLVLRVIALPVGLVGGSVGDVFYNRMAEIARETPGDARRFFWSTARSLFLASLIPALALLLFGPQLFVLVFGPNWLTAGQIAAIFSFWIIGQIAVSSLSRLVFVFQGQESKLVYDVVNLFTSIIVFPISSAQGWSLLQAMGFYTAGNVLSYTMYFFLLWRIVVTKTQGQVA